MRRNIKLLIAYDGTDFHGWQRQTDIRTVQGTIEDIIRRVVGHPLSLRGSGRTDAGVHARGQVANFHTDCTIPIDNLRRAIGSRLPRDIGIRDAHEVHPDFVATASASSKLYRYRVFNSPRRPVGRLDQRYCYHCWHDLSLERLRQAADHLVGTMDFAAMASAGAPRETTTRTVLSCHVHRHLDELRFDVEGTGFLYNQVRNMVGTLIEVGRGHWPVERIPEILESRQRRFAGPTAPANGLCLQWVHYPAELLRPPDDAERGDAAIGATSVDQADGST